MCLILSNKCYNLYVILFFCKQVLVSSRLSLFVCRKDRKFIWNHFKTVAVIPNFKTVCKLANVSKVKHIVTSLQCSTLSLCHMLSRTTGKVQPQFTEFKKVRQISVKLQCLKFAHLQRFCNLYKKSVHFNTSFAFMSLKCCYFSVFWVKFTEILQHINESP